MTGAAPRVEQQRVVGEAQVLQVFEMPDKRQDRRTAVAGCRVSDGSIRVGATYKVLRGGEVVRIPRSCPCDPEQRPETCMPAAVWQLGDQVPSQHLTDSVQLTG